MGYGFDAINVIKNNRTLLKKRKFKDVKKLVLKSADKTEAQFMEVSFEELEKIKNNIRREARKLARRELFIYGSLAAILLILFLRAGYELLQMI